MPLEHSRSNSLTESRHNISDSTHPPSSAQLLDERRRSLDELTTGSQSPIRDVIRDQARSQSFDRRASCLTESQSAIRDVIRDQARSQLFDRRASRPAGSQSATTAFTRSLYRSQELGESASSPTDTIREVRIDIPTSQDAGQSSLSNEALRIYTQRVIKDLKIPPELHDQAEEQIKSMYRILEKSEKATSEQEYDEACQNVLKLAPDLTILRWMQEGEFGKVSGALFFGGNKTRLETNNIRTRGDLRIARESEGKSYLSRLSDQVTHELAWRLNEPVYRASLASVLGVASTLTPFAYGGKFEPMAIPINIAATYIDTAIFKNFNYPWNLLITTGVWQGSSFATAYSQLGVDKLTELVKHLRG